MNSLLLSSWLIMTTPALNGLTGTDEENNTRLASFRLSTLTSALVEEILFGCNDKFALGTATYNTAIQAAK